MTIYYLSQFISGFIFYKIGKAKKILKKTNRENKFLVFFFKLGSKNLKNSNFLNEKNMLMFLKTRQINSRFIKIILTTCFDKNIKLLQRQFKIFDIYSIVKKETVLLYELFYQFYSRILKKNSLASSLIFNTYLGLNRKLKNAPTIRVVLSGITSLLKKKVSGSVFGLLKIFLKNPLLYSKSLIQEIIWNNIRLESKAKKIYNLFLEIRSVSFLNNSRNSLFFFSFIFKFFKMYNLKPFLNFCIKNVHKFIDEKIGQFLILFIVNNFYVKKRSWINLLLYKNLFYSKIFFDSNIKIFFCYFLRKTTRVLNRNQFYKIISDFKKRNSTISLVEEMIYNKFFQTPSFISIFFLNIFKINVHSYPILIQDEFVRSIKTERITDKRSLDINNFQISKKKCYYWSNFNIKKKGLFGYMIKIKNLFPEFRFIFFLTRIVLKYLFNFFKKKNSLEKFFHNIFYAALVKKNYLRFNIIDLFKIPIFIDDNFLIRSYKINKLYENQ